MTVAATRWHRRRAVSARISRLALVMRIAVRVDDACGRCEVCRLSFEYERLEIDHVDGRLWASNKMSPHTRVAKYWREFLSGVRLRTLCKECNARDGAHRGWKRRRSRK